MDKIYLVRFLKEGKRGVYKMIANIYSDTLLSTGTNLALEIIKSDLEKESGETVELNYFSLAQAKKKLEPKTEVKEKPTKSKWLFKDNHEVDSKDNELGRFKMD